MKRCRLHGAWTSHFASTYAIPQAYFFFALFRLIFPNSQILFSTLFNYLSNEMFYSHVFFKNVCFKTFSRCFIKYLIIFRKLTHKQIFYETSAKCFEANVFYQKIFTAREFRLRTVYNWAMCKLLSWSCKMAAWLLDLKCFLMFCMGQIHFTLYNVHKILFTDWGSRKPKIDLFAWNDKRCKTFSNFVAKVLRFSLHVTVFKTFENRARCC